MMKSLHYFLLFCVATLFVSCVEDVKDRSQTRLSDEEIAENYLNLSQQAILFGNVTLDVKDNFVSGWVLDKAGNVVEVEFSDAQQPGFDQVFELSQMKNVVAQGQIINTVDDKYAIMRNHVDVGDVSVKFSAANVKDNAYFAVIPVEEDISEPGGCGPNSTHELLVTYEVRILSSGSTVLNNAQAKETISWLTGINSELN